MTLSFLAQVTGAELSADGATVYVEHDGVRVTQRLHTLDFYRIKHEVSVDVTDFEVAVPAGEAIALAIRTHTDFGLTDLRALDDEKVARGTLVDLQVGDPAFDDRYVIEAAPASVVRKLLTPELRELMLARDASLRVVDGVHGRMFQLRARHWIISEGEARRIWKLVAALPAALRAANHELDTALPGRGAPFRGHASSFGAQMSREARAAEVEKLERVLRRRLTDTQATLVFFGLLAAALIALCVYVTRH